MQRFRMIEFVLAAFAVLFTAPALAQTWGVTEAAGDGGARASICPVGEEGSNDFLCFRLECTALEPIHFTLDVAGRGAVTESLAVSVGVDGGDVGVLSFTPVEAEGYTRYTAPFDPRLHEELVDLLQRGLRASLTLNWPTGGEDLPMGLAGSSDSLSRVMDTCPRPAPPVDDPGGLVLEEVVAACGELGGTVALETGFERREDLDGDGREDRVIDYAAAACSESATLNCSSGGCTVGFFLARDEGFTRMFADVIRGYEVFPGGFLALDLHGTACGLYGFEACRKVFDIAGDAPVLVEEIGGPDAEAMAVASAAGVAAAPETGPDAETAAGSEIAADPEAGAAPEPVVVAVTEGVVVELETAGPVAVTPSETALAAPETAAAPAGATVADDASVATATGATTEAETETVAAVAPAATPVEPPTPAPAAGEGSGAATGDGTAAAAAPDPGDAEGPTSRHDAGPAPAVPANAEFRGDGTLVLPEVALQ